MDGQNTAAESAALNREEKQPSKGVALASFIVGIVSLAFGGSFILGILAMVFGIVSKKNSEFSMYSTAGIVMGIVSIAWYVLSQILAVIIAILMVVFYVVFYIFIVFLATGAMMM